MTPHRLTPFGCLLFLVAASWSASAAAEADLVLLNGRIVTVDERVPEAEALAIEDDRISAIGTIDEIETFIGSETRVIDLEGRLAIPGFIESHAHFLGLGDARLQLDLASAGSWDDIVAMVAGAVGKARPGELIRGRGWHQEKWDAPPEANVLGLPLHDSLSRVSPDHPVVLVHASGHASFANAKAMELAGIDGSTPDPDGGQIVRDEHGRPIGMFRETAAGLLGPAYEAATPPDPRRMAELAVDECLAKGITSFQDAGSSFETVDLLKAMVDEGRLGVRLWVMLRESNDRLRRRGSRYHVLGYGDDRLTVRAIKRSIDGALGSHGAWLLEPYADLPGSIGLNTTPVEEIEETARYAADHDFQLCVHAIGDRANRVTLDVFEAACGEKSERRWRIEHAQHLHPDDVPRFEALGVIASMQGVHCTSDAPYVVQRLGSRRAQDGAYVWRKLLNSGAIICNGTDAPVEDVDPIASFAASVTRQSSSGRRFHAEQRMTREEALRSYTIDAAYAAFEEESKGSLAKGKLADVTVLSKDILTCPEDEIASADVVYTIVGGKVAYEKAKVRR